MCFVPSLLSPNPDQVILLHSHAHKRSTTTATTSSLFPLGHEASHAFNPTDEEHALLVMLPDQHANLVRVLARCFILCLGLEVLEQKAWRGRHAFTFELPEVDLVDYSCRQDIGRDGGWGVGVQCARGGCVGVLAAHLRMGVCGQVCDDLVGSDAGVDGALDRVFGDLGCDEVGMAGAKVREESQQSDLQWGGRVGVEAEVCLEDYEAGDRGAAGAGGGSGASVAWSEGRAERGGGVRESGQRVGGQSRSEAGRVEYGRVSRWAVEDAEVLEIGEHGSLAGGQVGGGVGEAKFHGGDEEEEGEDVDL